MRRALVRRARFGYNPSMPTTRTPNALTAARQLLADPVSYDVFLQKLGGGDRLRVERHLAKCEENPHHAALYKRLACGLYTLAPQTPKVLGNDQQTIQYYVPDGKYRMQVFALEDVLDGMLNVYCGDATEEATSAGLLVRRTPRGGGPPPDAQPYLIKESGDPLVIERLDSGGEHRPFYKDMLGWNRRAVRIRLPNDANKAQATAVETFCALSLTRAGK